LISAIAVIGSSCPGPLSVIGLSIVSVGEAADGSSVGDVGALGDEALGEGASGEGPSGMEQLTRITPKVMPKVARQRI